MVGIFVVAQYQVWFKKHRLELLSVFMILGITIYSIGYLTKYPNDYFSSGLMAIFSTGRMFVFENDISSFELNVASLPYYNLIFGLIMTISMLTVGMVALSFLGYQVLSKIQLGFMRFFVRKQKFYIYTNLSEKALRLARDIKKNNSKSIIIFCIEDVYENKKSLEKKASEFGCLVISKDHLISAQELSSNSHLNSVNHLTYIAVFNLCKKLKNKQIIIFAMDDDDHMNVMFATAFGEKINTAKLLKLKMSLYVFITKNEYIDFFNDALFSNIDLHIIDENDLACRQLFSDFTLMRCAKNTDLLTVCVIGYTAISENLYKNITFLGQCYGTKLELLLIDDEIKDKTAMFFNQNSEIKKCARFTLEEIKQDSVEFFQYFRNNIQKINCIIFADDRIETAIQINRISRDLNHNVKIHIHVENDDKYNLLFKTLYLKEVFTFWSITKTFSERIIIDEKLDKLAKGFHQYYSELFKDKRSWDEITLYEKQSNRALALHVQSKLYTMGLEYVSGESTDLFDEQIQDKQILEKLAMSEHLRWNAFSFANGWRTMTSLVNQKKNKDEINKTHACLVDWEQLDMVSHQYCRDYKEADRNLIKNIGKILKSAGFGIEKIQECEGDKL